MVETGYRELIVMRHAKTEQLAGRDRARRLTSRGRRDARAAGRWLRDHGLEPGLVLASPAVRARDTAEIVCAELSSAPGVQVVDLLYGASVDDVMELVEAVGLGAVETGAEAVGAGELGAVAGARRIMVVGHNPTMAELAYAVQLAPVDPLVPHLPTAGLAVVAVDGGWSDLDERLGRLTHWQVPRG